MADRLIPALRWFLDHLDSDPERIHVSGVYSDEEGGSRLGAPALEATFARWLFAGEASRMTRGLTVPCFHVGREEGDVCGRCRAVSESGVVYESGVYRTESEVYRWPMRAALSRVRHAPVRAGRPDLAVTLLAIARAEGDLAAASECLSRKFPAMADDAVALTHFGYALCRVRAIWQEEAPPRRTEVPRPPDDCRETSLAPALSAHYLSPDGSGPETRPGTAPARLPQAVGVDVPGT